MTWGPTLRTLLIFLGWMAGGLLADPPPFAAETDAERDRTSVDRFARLLVDGRIDDAGPLMDETLRSRLGADTAAGILQGLEQRYGPLQRLERAWHEDTVQGYDRYRVPAAFEKQTIDFRIAVDGTGLIGGLFVVPHVPPNGDGAPAVAEATAPVSELELTVADDLPATLSLPEGPGPHPAVVLIHGSGPQDRDSTIGPNKPFRDLAWGLAGRGVAVLRYDKRSYANPGSLTALGDAITVEAVAVVDARLAIALLRGRPEIDAGKVFVAGHSLGGQVAPRIVAADSRLAGLVLLAGSALPLHEKVLTQTRYILGLDGEIGEDEARQLAAIEESVARVSRALSGDGDLPDGTLLGVPYGYWADLAAHDSPAEAAALEIPILVIQGGRDYQVTLDDFELWKAALQGRPKTCLRVYASLDHLLRPGSGRSVPSDYQTAIPVSGELIGDLANWIGTGSCP